MANTDPINRVELPLEAEPARAFIEALVARYESRIKVLEDKIEKLTRRYSSLPPSIEHPHAKPKRKPTKNNRTQGGPKKAISETSASWFHRKIAVK